MKNQLTFLLLCVAALSCERKDLLEPHSHMAEIELKLNLNLDVNVATDIVNLPDPETASYIFFSHDGKTNIQGSVSGVSGKIQIPYGTYDVILYTSDFYPVDAVMYRGGNTLSSFEAYTRQSIRQKAATSVYNITDPDPLFAEHLKGFVITPDKHNYTIELPLLQYSFFYYVTIEVEGLKYVHSVTLDVEGMYTSVFFKDSLHRENEEGVHSVDMQIKEKENKIYGEFWAFGPHRNGDIKNTMTLRFINGKSTTIVLDDLSDRVKALTRGGEIVVPQKFIITGGDGGDGFNPEVGDWDKTEVEVPI